VAVLIYSPDLVLPWAPASDNDQRFKRILRNLLIGFLLFSLIIPFLPVEEITREKREALPTQLARVIMEKRELEKPIPVPPKPTPVKKEKPKEREKPKEKVEPKVEPKKTEAIKEAQKKAAVSGVLAFQDDLADMRDSLDMDELANTDVTRNDAQAAKVERSIITSGAVASGSSGIKTSALSRDTGGQALSARETTRVESPVTASGQADGAGSSASMGGRSDQSIRRVMDKNKGAIFSIYNRALRKDPTLQGKLVFEMVIEPSGQVSEVKLLSSELGDEALTRKILSRIRLIRFEAADVIITRVNYSFDFLPY
jgi:protein TonB